MSANAYHLAAMPSILSSLPMQACAPIDYLHAMAGRLRGHFDIEHTGCRPLEASSTPTAAFARFDVRRSCS